MVSAAIAQLVEQGTENPCVLGSIPSCGTILKRPQRGLFFIAKKSTSDVLESMIWFVRVM